MGFPAPPGTHGGGVAFRLVAYALFRAAPAMECRAAVSVRRLIGLALLAVASCLAVAGPADTVVLIVNAGTSYAALDSVEVRKLFLGLTVVRDGHALHALRNVGDPRLDQ